MNLVYATWIAKVALKQPSNWKKWGSCLHVDYRSEITIFADSFA